MLAPNWEDHDLETNPIVNYFADRQHTELILKKLKVKLKRTVSTAKYAAIVTSKKNLEKFSNSKDSGHLIKK